MIDYGMAKALKTAGLQWEPQQNDLYHDGGWIHCNNDANMRHAKVILQYEFCWLPRLDQLLAEVEKNGFQWQLDSHQTLKEKWYEFRVINYDGRVSKEVTMFTSDIPDIAVADALLWILQQKLKGKGVLKS